VLHFLARVSAFAVFATGLAGCSLLLDWSDYTDGFADAAAGAGDTGQPTGPADAGHPDETNQPDEAGTDSAAIEAGGNPPDASPDAGGDSLVPPPCSPTTCMGCCSATGDCQGGQSANSCGAGGQTCQDCQTSGLACVSGSCAAADSSDAAAPPTCTVSMCNTKLCIPAWQAQCCKSDNTCGCEVLYPPGSCM
jgi:hypothetical protein